MQSHFIHSLITRVRIVISAVIFAMTVCGCGRSEKAVFTDTEFSAADTAEAQDQCDEGGNEAGTGSSDSGSVDNAGDPEDRTEDLIYVFVCGAVAKEGVYGLPEGARVIDAVNAAGGYTEDADRRYVNQAEYVYDAQKVEIPTIDEVLDLRGEGTEGGSLSADSDHGDGSGRVNINTADLDELMTIPGIGESKARKILSYRNEHGRFGSTEEIMNISGIGSGNYEAMKDFISVN